jgi:hypothetical protein
VSIVSWQKSSYCGEGESCIFVAAAPDRNSIRLTESADPTGAVLTTTPTAFRSFVRALKNGSSSSGRRGLVI